MFCTNCGSEQRDGVKFCTNCGAPLEGSSPQEPSHPQHEPTPAE